MTKQMLTLIDSVLSSTARTARAAVLIVILALAPGAAPVLDVVVPDRSAVPASEVGTGQRATR